MERHLALPGSVPKVPTGGARCFGRLSQAPGLLGARRDGRPSVLSGYGARTPVVPYHDATARTGEGVAPSGRPCAVVLLPCPDTGAGGASCSHARTHEGPHHSRAVAAKRPGHGVDTSRRSVDV